MYKNRYVENKILKLASSFPCVAVYGPRQVGKSTTVEYLFQDKIKRVSLDNIKDRELAILNPKLFLENYGFPLIIDEIQKAPNLLDEIKIRVDEERLSLLKSGKERSLMYIITGSNRFELQQGISESLAGRCGIIEMNSFSTSEKYGYSYLEFHPNIKRLKERIKSKNKLSLDDVYNNIFNGGMPDVVLNNSDRDSFYESYVETYIEKDVKKIINVDSELQFKNFIKILAFRTAQELKYEDISQSVGIDVRTCKRWLSILQSSGLIYLLHPYMANMSNRIIKSPKIYFMDCGLCAYLCGWQDYKMLENCAMSGAFLETYIVSEIVKNLNVANNRAIENLYYYRDKDKKEIDLLYVDIDSIYPIEIKKGVNPTKPTKNFDVLSKFNKKIEIGLVIDMSDDIRPINEKAYEVPAWII